MPQAFGEKALRIDYSDKKETKKKNMDSNER